MASPERLRADALSLRVLAAINSQHLSLAYTAPDLRRFALDVRLDAPVVTADGYRIASEHRLAIEIPDNYLSRDANGFYVKSRIRRVGEPLFHPNVYRSDGYACFDSQFLPVKTLADQVVSVLSLMQLQSVNHLSPADWPADFHFLEHGQEIRAQMRPVEIRVPRGGVRVSRRSLPKVAS